MKNKYFYLVLFLFSTGIHLVKSQMSEIPQVDGVYQISTASHLLSLSLAIAHGEGEEAVGRTFKLMNDIDMRDITTFVPIGGWIYRTESNDFVTYFVSPTSKRHNFWGIFEGNDHKISNLTLEPNDDIRLNYNSGRLGFFGAIVDATVENLFIDNIMIKTPEKSRDCSVGGLAAEMHNSNIHNCFIKMQCETFGLSRSVGGVVGNAEGSIITESSSHVSIITYGCWATGGFAGAASNSTISKCYSKGSVSGLGSGQWAYDLESGLGGFIGNISQDTKILNCYSRTGILATYDDICNISIGGFNGADGASVFFPTLNNSIIVNCYAAPVGFEILNCDVAGLFSGIPPTEIVRCFYSTAISGFQGIGWCPVTFPTYTLLGKSDEEFRAPAMVDPNGDAQTSLNYDQSSPFSWIQDYTPPVNNGFPILEWQKKLGIQPKPIPKSVNVFPNPTTGELRIKNEESVVLRLI